MERNVGYLSPSMSTRAESPTTRRRSSKETIQALVNEALTQKPPMQRHAFTNGDLVYRIGNLVVIGSDDCSNCSFCKIRAASKKMYAGQCGRENGKAKVEQDSQGSNKPAQIIPAATKRVKVNMTVDELKEDSGFMSSGVKISLKKENVTKSRGGKDQISPGPGFPVFQFLSRSSVLRSSKQTEIDRTSYKVGRPSVLQIGQVPVPATDTLVQDQMELLPQVQAAGTIQEVRKGKKSSGSSEAKDQDKKMNRNGKDKKKRPENRKRKEIASETKDSTPEGEFKLEVRSGFQKIEKLVSSSTILAVINDGNQLHQASDVVGIPDVPGSLSESTTSAELKLSRFVSRTEASGKTFQEMFGNLTDEDPLMLSDDELKEVEAEDGIPYGQKNVGNQPSTQPAIPAIGNESSDSDIEILAEFSLDNPNPENAKPAPVRRALKMLQGLVKD